ncbi:DNA excision repair protein ERCC-4 [Nematocida sp. AWRm77]|nr:DNA excision repair protein ERCC-4 [Nematocida sp. AWRm77]
MHAHEKQIAREVCTGERTAHLLYTGANLQRIVTYITKHVQERLVVVGASSKCVAKLKKMQSKDAEREMEREMEKISEGAKKEAPAKKPKKSGKKEKAVKKKPVLSKIREIDQKTTALARTQMYAQDGCVFVPERLFLTDILKGRVPETNMKVLYLLEDSASPSLKPVREFIYFSLQCKLSVLVVYGEEFSFLEEVQSAYVPSSGIFLYPAFRKRVAKAMGSFQVGEMQVKTDVFRAQIQTHLLELVQKVENLPIKSLFGHYVQNRKNSLLFSGMLLINGEARTFLEYFQEVTDLKKNLDTLEGMYGAEENEYKRDAKYGACLSWLLLDAVEETAELGKELVLSEKTNPKRKVLASFVEKNEPSALSVIACGVPEELLEPLSSAVKIVSAYYLESEIKRIAKAPHPHIVLLNYTIPVFRRIKLLHRQWKARGVCIKVSVITMSNSMEELANLEVLKKEKDVFIAAIGMKKNRPEFIEKPVFVLSPSMPNTPVLAIDLRELRSSLPFALAKRFTGQLKFEFQLLTQGDYVLNQAHFVERKSMGDLIESFKTGRLFKQMEVLIHSHEEGYLLIEFPEKEKLSFHAYCTNRFLDIDLAYGVVALLQTVPRVKIFLSNSPAMSASLIHALARKASAPSLASESTMHPHLIEALLSIPGVTHEKLSMIFERFSSIYDLATSSKERLSASLPDNLGLQIFEFFNSPIVKISDVQP